MNNRIALTGTERIDSIITSLRNFARLDEADLQETDLHEGIESMGKRKSRVCRNISEPQLTAGSRKSQLSLCITAKP